MYTARVNCSSYILSGDLVLPTKLSGSAGVLEVAEIAEGLSIGIS